MEGKEVNSKIHLAISRQREEGIRDRRNNGGGIMGQES